MQGSNIYDDMPTLEVGECLKGVKSVCKQKCFGLYLLETRTYASVNIYNRLFKVI